MVKKHKINKLKTVNKRHQTWFGCPFLQFSTYLCLPGPRLTIFAAFLLNSASFVIVYLSAWKILIIPENGVIWKKVISQRIFVFDENYWIYLENCQYVTDKIWNDWGKKLLHKMLIKLAIYFLLEITKDGIFWLPVCLLFI